MHENFMQCRKLSDKSAVRDSVSQRIFLFPLFYPWFWKRKYFLLPSLFRVYEYEVQFYSFYSSYLYYEHKFVYTT